MVKLTEESSLESYTSFAHILLGKDAVPPDVSCLITIPISTWHYYFKNTMNIKNINRSKTLFTTGLVDVKTGLTGTIPTAALARSVLVDDGWSDSLAYGVNGTSNFLC